jgi:predicted ribosome quality control (RQC) complex YloA/Tae2 family protein
MASMKEGLSSFDVLAVVAELQDLVGGHVDKIYQDGDVLMLKVNAPGAGKRELHVEPGRWLCLRTVEEKPTEPPPFALALRGHLANARIEGIEQREFDRIVVLRLHRGAAYDLVLELFGKGNVVLVREGEVVLCHTIQRYRDRLVKPGSPYDFPPRVANPLAMDRETFGARLAGAKGSVVKALASGLSLGGLYAEELCLRAGVDKKAKARDLSPEEIDGLFGALQDLLEGCRERRQPALVLKDGEAVDVVPADLRQYDGFEKEPFPTFNEALAAYVPRLAATTRVAAPEADVAARYRRRIERQEATAKELREEAQRLEAQALFLYSHYETFDELLRAVRERRQEEHEAIKRVDFARGTVVVAIGEGDEIVLDVRKDVNQNAQMLYGRRKAALEKLARVEEAIEATRREREDAVRRATKAAARPKVAPTKRFWFEAYRWCRSSEGFLLLGGRDARTNDGVVKRHLRDGDRYAHADVHGAPSVVVKEGSRAGEATLREACAFSLVYSKAWSAGLASGSAYWVLPEQVSKTAESGEYLPRGAFVVRGKRNYVRDLPLRVAVGEIVHEGHRKVMGGPVEAVKAHASRYVVLEPGEGDRNVVARELAATFAVPVEEVQRVLPPGGVHVVRAEGMDLP